MQREPHLRRPRMAERHHADRCGSHTDQSDAPERAQHVWTRPRTPRATRAEATRGLVTREGQRC
jgi:hypothetical protein